MSPLPFPLFGLLRSLVLRWCVLRLVGWCVAREERMRARVVGMKAGRRRERAMRALAEAVRVRAVLAEPGFLEDARTLGKAAEVARCLGDAGRRALARRFGRLFSRGRGMRAIGGAAVPADRVMGGRCRGGHGVA